MNEEEYKAELKQDYFNKADKLAEQLVLQLKSEFSDDNLQYYGMMNTLSLAIIKYSLENHFNPEIVIHTISQQFANEAARMLYELQQQSSPHSVN